MTVLAPGDANLRTMLEHLEVHQDHGHADPSHPKFGDYLTDIQTTIADGHIVVYPYRPPATEEERLSFLVTQSALAAARLLEILSLLRTVPPPPTEPSGVWTFTQGGTKFQGRSPMPASIVDTDAAWGVSVTNLKDARGENPAAGATIALTVDDADVVTITDNGDGTGTVVAGPLATSETPASTAINAVITNTDGTSFTVSDVITVVGSAAVTGDFGFTPPA